MNHTQTPPSDSAPRLRKRSWPPLRFRALEKLPDSPADSPGGPAKQRKSGGGEKIPWADRSPSQRQIYNRLLWCTYHLTLLLAPIFRRRRPSAEGRALRVLRVTSTIAQGGVAKVVVQTLMGQDAGGVETTLFVFGKKLPVPPALAATDEVHCHIRKMELFTGSFKFVLFRNIIKLARVISRARPDVVHLHEPQFAPILRMACTFAGGVPLLVHLHSVYTERREETPALHRELELHALRALPIISCSRTIEQGARDWLKPLSGGLHLIEDGADDRDPWGDPVAGQMDELAVQLGRAAGDRIVIAKMARLVPLKRIEDFMTACRILLDEGYPIYVLLMSYGKEGAAERKREEFESWFGPEEGEFLFQVPYAAPLLRHVGIGVSASQLEGLGLNILEYQIAGVPVVCTDIPAHREMVDHDETGLLFPPADPPAMLRCLKRLLDDPGGRSRLAEAGRARAAQRRWADAARATERLYRDLLSPGSKS